MCGIALLINKSKNIIEESVIRSMTDLVEHRGPDGSGTFIEGDVALGHRRLAILDLSECGKQPMFFEDYAIVFNGEIYNYIELRDELKGYGYEFVSGSDTEVLLKAYDKWGEECVHHLRGMWAFSIYDRKKDIVFLSRDRFGIKPLHYTETPTAFLAGSEIKQFTAVDDFEPVMFQPIVYEFLMHGALNHNKFTFYKDVYSLQPGHNLIYNLKDHQFKIYQWYFLEKVPVKKKMKPDEAFTLFRNKFKEAVNIHLRSDVKLGSCLSGGLDSSSIVTMSREILGNKMPIYTVTSCNEEAEYDEREYSEAVVEACKTEEVLTFPDLDALYSDNILEKICWHQDQPIGTGSHFSEYAVFEAARKNDLIVMLDGQGSDEYLAGYYDYFLYRCLGLLKAGRFIELAKTVKERSVNRGIPVKSIYLNILKLMVNTKRQISFNPGPWLNEKWAEKQKNSPAVTYKGHQHIENIRDLSLLNMKAMSIPYQLHSEDRNSMIFSIESRVPFLDHELVESMFGLPEDIYYNHGLDKNPIREGLKDILPEKIYNRKTKLGFASSDDIWMRKNGEKIRQKLEVAVNYFKDILDPQVLQEFDKYLAGQTGYNNIFFRILSLYAWAKVAKVKMEPELSKEQKLAGTVS